MLPIENLPILYILNPLMYLLVGPWPCGDNALSTPGLRLSALSDFIGWLVTITQLLQFCPPAIDTREVGEFRPRSAPYMV